jgi:beta-glucosidase
VGYRDFDKRNVEPLFPFGYGLAYSTFAYSDLRVFPATPRYGQLVQLALKVRNTGARAGADVVQVYVHQVKSSVDRPVKELKAFQRVELKGGETREVTFELDRRSMSFYDPMMKTWATEPGVFEVLVGASAGDIRLKRSFELFE